MGGSKNDDTVTAICTMSHPPAAPLSQILTYDNVVLIMRLGTRHPVSRSRTGRRDAEDRLDVSSFSIKVRKSKQIGIVKTLIAA